MNKLNEHYNRIVDAIKSCQIVPFLGSNINLCGRLKNSNGELESWEPGGNTPPNNEELAVFLDKERNNFYTDKVCCPLIDIEDVRDLPHGCPAKEKAITKIDLPHISQYALTHSEDGPDFLYGTLRKHFDTKYSPNPIHKFFVQLPGLMSSKGYYPPYPLIVSTCFDRTLEQAFEDANEPYDLVTFILDQGGGMFAHIPPGGDPRPINNPNEYQELTFEYRPVIVKLYGGFEENYVITEDQYIDYLAHRDITDLLPANLLQQLRRKNIWFMGYSPCYWNLRVIMHRLWPQQMSGTRSKTWWAVQSLPEVINQPLWRRYNCIPYSIRSLEVYIADLEKQIHKVSEKNVSQPSSINAISQPPVERDQIFISYSHTEKAWLEKLKLMLAPAIKSEKIALWDDTKIKPGTKWREEIKSALGTAKVAVMLVSTKFLASDFISQEELPPLLEAAKKEGLKIIWILINDCLYKFSPIQDYQAAYDPSKPLDKLPEPEQQTALRKISEEIISAITT